MGWFLSAAPDSLDRLGRRWPVHLVCAVGLTVAWFALVGTSLTPIQLPVPEFVVSLTYALGAWQWVYGLLGAATTLLTRELPVIRYLADASYWMYLLHLPLVLLVALLVGDQPWPAGLKLVLIVGGPTVLMLVTYQLLVRSTFLGAWLNGRRYPSRPSRAELTSVTP